MEYGVQITVDSSDRPKGWLITMEYGVQITVDSSDRPKGWASIAVGPRYGYNTTIRGMFTEDDLDGQLSFIHSAVETVINLERMNAEADATQADALDAKAASA